MKLILFSLLFTSAIQASTAAAPAGARDADGDIAMGAAPASQPAARASTPAPSSSATGPSTVAYANSPADMKHRAAAAATNPPGLGPVSQVAFDVYGQFEPIASSASANPMPAAMEVEGKASVSASASASAAAGFVPVPRAQTKEEQLNAFMREIGGWNPRQCSFHQWQSGIELEKLKALFDRANYEFFYDQRYYELRLMRGWDVCYHRMMYTIISTITINGLANSKHGLSNNPGIKTLSTGIRIRSMKSL